MSLALKLLEDVRWRGTPVVGLRPRALFAALAASAGQSVRAEELIESVWGDETPVNGMKSLQVLVSRTRSVCGAGAIVRDGIGYRLGVAPTEVDSVRLSALVSDAGAALERDTASAAALARDALSLADGLPAMGDEDPGPLGDIRRTAAAEIASAHVILARARSRMGAYADALSALEAAHAERPQDESLLADLLRSEAAVRGPAAALERFEHYRRDVRERLGASPGDVLQRAHRHLLALDHPVRHGVRYDATTLFGRDRDVERLRGLMVSSRVVSIVGAGGMGKTRLAHVLARDATVPAVHVVELVGVSSPQDVVGEVGSVLGVRDSISGRRRLTPEQRADVRARIAQRLSQSPSLLVLDNCEHLVGAVAELVAFLVSTTADVRILTTSRAPLTIAAERVYLLGELEVADAAELFRERAVAARPGVHLSEEVVRSIVTRLDGLPLAIELAAARVRAMAVEEVDRRLENRFALLRGGDRGAPDRHQTLLAVIDWSWNLLEARERRTLRWLALFNDGFTLEAAGAVLGDDAVDSVQGLVEQSLLSVRETPTAVRYRMLETVREFGRMQLVDAGEDAAAQAARRRWAVAHATRHGPRLAGAEQFAAIDAMQVEEVNLSDELRGAIAEGDTSTLVQLLAALGLFWSIRGEHGRLVIISDAVSEAVRGWRPPAEVEDATRTALGITLTNARMTGKEHTEPMRVLLQQLGPSPADPNVAALVKVTLALNPGDATATARRLEQLADDPDRHTAVAACHWLSHVRENAGDLVGAIDAAESSLALLRPDDGPWHSAQLRSQLAQLTMHTGNRGTVGEHARAAVPVMHRIGALDDEIQLRSLLVLCAIADGRLADAETELEQLGIVNEGEAIFGGTAIQQVGQAELALARGDHGTGLRLYRQCAAHMRELRFPGISPTGVESWTLFGEATALAAFAHYAGPAEEVHGRAMFAECRADALRALDASDQHLDYPVAGLLLFALGAWGLLRDAAAADDAVRLLALADRFAYHRTIPTMMWERIAPRAEHSAPGRIAAARAEYRNRRPPDLVTEARRVVERLAGSDAGG